MSVFPRIPSKLNPQFDCQALYNFNGDFTDTSGLAPANLSATGTWTFTLDHGNSKQGLLSLGTTTRLTSGVTPRLLLLGDVTVQVVCFIPTFSHDTGTNLFGYDGDGTVASAENAAWKIAISNYTDRLVPSFVWEQGAGVTQVVEDNQFSLQVGQWNHIVGIRDGTNARLYVNRVLVASAAGITLPDGGSNAKIRIGEVLPATTEGLNNGTIISSAKVSNRVLTESELNQEFGRVRGSV